MSQQEKDHRIILKSKQAREELLKGAQFIYEPVSTTFGPKGMNILIEKSYGRPLATRDGVTVARDVYSKYRGLNMGAQLLLEGAETTDRVGGDGTTGTIVLTYHLIRLGIQLIASGVHPMEVKEILIKDSEVLLDKLEELAKPVKKHQLKEVATVSSGDPLLGQLISEAVEYVGKDGGIMTEGAPVPNVEREYVDGYFIQQGFQALQTGRKEITDPFVIIVEKRLTGAAEIADLLTKTLQTVGFKPEQGIPRFVIIGNIEEMAYRSLVDLINQGRVDCIIIKTPPQFGEMGREVLADIAAYCKCDFISETTNIQKDFNRQVGSELYSSYIGSASRVVSNHSETTIFSDNTTEAVKTRIQEIKDRLKDEASDNIAEKLRQRVSMLEGRIAIFRIGGATDSEKEEKSFRIEDSINATRAAEKYGVVPGGAVTLVELSKCKVSETYKKALQAVFKKLLRNANLPVDLKLDELLKAPYGMGFNPKKSDQLVDMVKDGVLDPVLVLKEIIRNSTAQAHIALTTGNLVIFEDSKED